MMHTILLSANQKYGLTLWKLKMRFLLIHATRLTDLSLRTDLHLLQSHTRPLETRQPIRNIRCGPSSLCARWPNQSSQSGGHWAVACQTALPKIPSVSPGLGLCWECVVLSEACLFESLIFHLVFSYSLPTASLQPYFSSSQLMLFFFLLTLACIPLVDVVVILFYFFVLWPAVLLLSSEVPSSFLDPPWETTAGLGAHVPSLWIIEHLFEINITTYTHTDLPSSIPNYLPVLIRPSYRADRLPGDGV